MSILITCNVARVESVTLNSLTPAERAVEGAVLRAVAPLIDKLDNELRRLNDATLRGLSREQDKP